jgi:hypothetical protein
MTLLGIIYIFKCESKAKAKSKKVQRIEHHNSTTHKKLWPHQKTPCDHAHKNVAMPTKLFWTASFEILANTLYTCIYNIGILIAVLVRVYFIV